MESAWQGEQPVKHDAKLSQHGMLLCRGVIFAIAHVRGGGDLGQYWYLDGKMGNKPNTFKDTIAAATHLIQVCCWLLWRLMALTRACGVRPSPCEAAVP